MYLNKQIDTAGNSFYSVDLSDPCPPPSSVYGHPSASGSGAPIYATSGGLHFPGPTASQAREEERRQQVYLSHQQGAR